MRKMRKIRNTAAGFLAMLLITTSLLPVSAFAAEQANGETQETAQETTMTSLSEETSEIASESNAESELPSDDTETHYKLEIDPFTPNGRILVNKVDADDGSPLMGAEFSVYDKDGKLVETKQTDDTGLVGFVLWQGRYTLVETRAPEGYQQDNREHKFELTDKQPQLWLEIENKKIVLNVTKTLIKYDQDTEESLSGAEFEILNRDHERIQTIVSEANGVKLTLPEGKYYIRELKAPEGYELDSEEHELIMQNEKLSTPILIPNKKAVPNVFVSKYDMHGNALPGAVLQLTRGFSEEILTWTSTDQPQAFTLSAGEYYLSEITPPDGYGKAYMIHFTVKEDGSVETDASGALADDGKTIVMIDKDPQSVVIRKTVVGEDNDAEYVFQGLFQPEIQKISIYQPDGTLKTVKEGNALPSTEAFMLTLKDGEYAVITGFVNRFVVGEYCYEDFTTAIKQDGVITETTAREDRENIVTMRDYFQKHPVAFEEYEKITGEGTWKYIRFSVGTKDAEVEFVNTYPTPPEATVQLSKQDVSGAELPGAKLELYVGEAADGELLESWISAETPHEISLPDGTYTLHEVIAPDGYEIATDITFTVDAEKNEVTVTGCETAAEGNMIVMIDKAKPVPEEPDKPTPEEPGKPAPKEMNVKFSKQDISGAELPGARMELYAGKKAQGKPLESWISGEKPYEIVLESGTYTLHEVVAPDGYEIATDITFVVNAEEKEVTLSDTKVTAPDNMVVMVDKAKPVPEKEEPTPEKPETPKPTEPEKEQPKPTEPETEQPKPEKPVNPDVPKTGDDTNLPLWYILSAISLIGAIALGGTAIYTQHKGRKDEQK